VPMKISSEAMGKSMRGLGSQLSVKWRSLASSLRSSVQKSGWAMLMRASPRSG